MEREAMIACRERPWSPFPLCGSFSILKHPQARESGAEGQTVINHVSISLIIMTAA